MDQMNLQGSGEPATRADLASVNAALHADITAFRAELKQDIAGVHSELKQDIADVRSELKQDIAGVRSELKQDIYRVAKDLVETKMEVREIRGIMDTHMATKDDIRRVLSAIDAFAKKAEAYDRKALSHGDMLQDHEARLRKHGI